MAAPWSRNVSPQVDRLAKPCGEARLAASRRPGHLYYSGKGGTGMNRPTTEPAKVGNVDVEALSHNVARLIEEGGKALAAYLKPREEGKIKNELSDDVTDVVKSLSRVAEYWMSDPRRALELQTSLGRAYLDLWANTVKRMAGEKAEPVAVTDPKDKRFADPEWSQNQFFDFLKQAYLLTTQWGEKLVKDAKGVDEHTRKKAEFYVKQIANAISPSNFVLTNPELLRETLSSSGENLVRGMHMLTEDIKAGHGNLRLRQSAPATFDVGGNLAVTPGKVVFQNELIQLIQYEATTKDVLKVPLLIVPPWINRFYILDLNPEKSFVKWCVDNGISLFMVSWKSADESIADATLDDYVLDGQVDAIDTVRELLDVPSVHTIGYCVAGTTLAATLAYLETNKQANKVKSATFLTAQVDFTEAGDLRLFTGRETQ